MKRSSMRKKLESMEKWALDDGVRHIPFRRIMNEQLADLQLRAPGEDFKKDLARLCIVSG
jgi:hypothetical protein